MAVMADVTVSDTVKLQSPRQVLGTWLINNSTWSSQLMWKLEKCIKGQDGYYIIMRITRIQSVHIAI